MNRDVIRKFGILLASGLAAIALAGWCRAGERDKLDRAAVLRELSDFTLAGMGRRFGPHYAACHRGGLEKFPGSPFCISATNVN